jgi:hypothetical protein
LFSRILFALPAIVLLAGCGGGGIEVKLYPVTGTVTKSGSAISGIKVILETSDPSLKAPMLYAVTDAEGKYEIQTMAGEKGAPVGLYKVYLVPKPPEMDYANPTGPPQKATDVVPAMYQAANTTEFSVDVSTSGAKYDIQVP